MDAELAKDPAVARILAKRIKYYREIWDAIAARFDVGSTRGQRRYCVRRDAVVDHVCEELNLQKSWKTRREVKEVVERMGGVAISPMNRRGFRGVRDKSKDPRDAIEETRDLNWETKH